MFLYFADEFFGEMTRFFVPFESSDAVVAVLFFDAVDADALTIWNQRGGSFPPVCVGKWISCRFPVVVSIFQQVISRSPG